MGAWHIPIIIGSFRGRFCVEKMELCVTIIDKDKSAFVEVNNFEKRDTYFIFCYCCNKCFSGTMAFLCSMDVSMV